MRWRLIEDGHTELVFAFFPKIAVDNAIVWLEKVWRVRVSYGFGLSHWEYYLREDLDEKGAK